MNRANRVLSIAVGLALSGAVAAQSAGTAGAGEATRGTASPSVNAPTGAPATPPATIGATHALRAVEDMVMDPASGRVLHALVSIGGVMGVGDKKYAVPTKDLSVFSKSADDSVPAKVTLGTPPDSLTPAKKLDKDSPYVMASKLIGTGIGNSEGKDVGEIEDVIVNLPSGEVLYAMVEFKEIVAPDHRLFAFKMSDFQRDKDGRKLVLDVTKETVNQVPSIDKTRIDKVDLSETSWAQANPAGSTTTEGTSAGAAANGAVPKGN